MKYTKLIIIIFILFLLSSCSYESNKDKEIVLLNKTIEEKELEIKQLKKKNELNAKIEKVRTIKSKIIERKLKSDIEKLKNQNTNNLQQKQVLILPKEKELNIKFYSQFPLDVATGKKYQEPYQNFWANRKISVLHLDKKED